MGPLPTKEEIVKILKEVKDPETEMSVFDLGLVKHVDYLEEKKTLILKCDFLRRNPSCIGCLPIAWLVQKRITDDLSKKFLAYEGITAVEFEII